MLNLSVLQSIIHVVCLCNNSKIQLIYTPTDVSDVLLGTSFLSSQFRWIGYRENLQGNHGLYHEYGFFPVPIFP